MKKVTPSERGRREPSEVLIAWILLVLAAPCVYLVLAAESAGLKLIGAGGAAFFFGASLIWFDLFRKDTPTAFDHLCLFVGAVGLMIGVVGVVISIPTLFIWIFSFF